MHLDPDQQLQLPRLTGTLRAFGKSSTPVKKGSSSHVDPDGERKALQKRRELTRKSLDSQIDASADLSWPLVVTELGHSSSLKTLLNSVRIPTAKRFLNEDINDPLMLNEAAVFLLETFHEYRAVQATSALSFFQDSDKIAKKLKAKFGSFARNQFDECKALMESVFAELAKLDKLDLLTQVLTKSHKAAAASATNVINTSTTKSERMFGSNIEFYSFYQRHVKTKTPASLAALKIQQTADNSPSDSSDEYASSDDDDDDDGENDSDASQSDRFAMNFPTISASAAFVAEQAQLLSDESVFTSRLMRWRQELGADLADIVLETLSRRDTDANKLQNELLELLGFDKIELIEQLFTNREQILNEMAAASNKTRRVTTAGGGGSNKPHSISTEITIHTETEKRLKKLMRKEDKRMVRGKAASMAQAHDEFLQDNFDPETLRQIREEQLAEARILQLYNQKRFDCMLLPPGGAGKRHGADQYPFVFDSLTKIAQTSAFVAGSKILLPMSVSRTDTHTFEEVHIPAAESLYLSDARNYVGTKEEVCFAPLINITEMDEVGQIVFKHVKTLNRIQTIVYEQAYNTNQNLLICAPTGAGKTNIALLAIAHELNNNLIEGVLRKDDFKIVYVAPMKALAAEMADNFSKRLAPLGISVRELTGDTQLTKQEIMKTQMLIVTPEKWDVITRKSMGDTSLSLLVKLLIIDEVHLLHDDRGSVIETIVARTLRQVESSQKMIRIVGLSATLPNYLDVAKFLNVDPRQGLFFFDSRFRPVPLAQTFIGVKSLNRMIQQQQMDDTCYDKVLKMVRLGHQVMVFVHARNATIKTALKLRDMAKMQGDIDAFLPEQSKAYGEAQKNMQRSRNKQLREIFDDGFAVHHAGMLRADRHLVEKCFVAGHIRVLVCTATLAWGVNLPAHAVVIKGTELYDATKGSFVDLSMLDILQIFGRAGRPQYDKSGEAFIITTHDKLAHYLSLLTRQVPIESQFIHSLADNLNAEVCLGSVTNVTEGSKWLSYTYLHVRMKFNPLAYGLTYKMLEADPGLENHRQELIRIAGRTLDKAHMIRFDEATGAFHSTDLGRTASHYYIKYDTVEMTNQKLRETMNDKEMFGLISSASEFAQLKVRDEELEELDRLHEWCELPVMGGIESNPGKVNCLIQAYIARNRVDGFSLVSDMSFVAQNVTRISRALFEITLKRGWALMTGRMLNICKSIEKQMWHFNNPMRQFESILSYEIISKLEDRHIGVERLRDMDAREIGTLISHQKMGDKLRECVAMLPYVDIETSLHPITRTVLRVNVTLTPKFTWNDRLHGTAEFFWVWIEDPDHDHIYHHEFVNVSKKQARVKEPIHLVFTIPIFEPLPAQYIVRVLSDRWLGVEYSHPVSFKHLILPDLHAPHTELLDLDPLPVSALDNPRYEALYSFTHFNPIQTQIFYCFFHTDNNCLLGAPTGSGKTIAAELAIFRVFNMPKRKKCVYIAPLKALVRERMNDWKVRFEQKLGKKVVELTGDVTPDMRMIKAADVIVTTPEKWDGISRSWQTRDYVQDVALIVIDEIHLLGEDRGPVLEVIVSRTNFISSHTNHPVRVVGMSTAVANARDLANWLGIKQLGLYNFKPSVRPVPLEVHIQSFPGKFYCPRMATMNKPCFQEIKMHSPDKPVLVFVSSRRQTRLTALDLISCLAADPNPKQWLAMPESEMNVLINRITDQNLKLTLAFGIGLHHAGLNDKDRKLVEELFLNQKIQILIATSTLAWGLNFPAHLVVVKGTEYYDGKTKKYVDFPITDVLQMMGRAGRPQFDDSGIAVIMVQDVKKHFYKKFLYEPFPVESSLLSVLSDHLCAEIVAGTITTKQEAMEYLTWTYFFRRLLMNPSYYELQSVDNKQINAYLSDLIQSRLAELEQSACIAIGEQSGELTATTSGRIASFYYLTHKTLHMFQQSLSSDITVEYLIDVLSMATEFSEFPVRHNEDKLNAELANDVPLKVNPYTLDSPHTKCNLILQAHYSRVSLPCSDYITDTKSVLDQALRIMQAMLDYCGDRGWLAATLGIVHLIQMTCQARWLSDSDLLTMPHLDTEHLVRFYNYPGGRVDCLPRLMQLCDKHKYARVLEDILGNAALDRTQIRNIYDTVRMLPRIDVRLRLAGRSYERLAVSGHASALDTSEAEVTKIGIDLDAPDGVQCDLYEDDEYVLDIELTRHQGAANDKQQKHRQQQDERGEDGEGDETTRSKPQRKGMSVKAYAPKYTKEKDENWIIVLGTNCDGESVCADGSSVGTGDLLALKRLSSVKTSLAAHLLFRTPRIERLPQHSSQFTLIVYLMSDVYLGLDQQYELKFNLKPKS